MAFAQSFAQYLNVLTDYGFNFSATRSIAQVRDQPAEISRIFCCVFLIKLLLTAVGLIALGCILLTVTRIRHDSTIFLCAFAGVLGNVLFPGWYFQGMERMRSIAIISGATKALSAVLIFVFVHNSRDGTRAVAIQSLGCYWQAASDLRSASARPNLS